VNGGFCSWGLLFFGWMYIELSDVKCVMCYVRTLVYERQQVPARSALFLTDAENRSEGCQLR
jgi:hypothetical protein